MSKNSASRIAHKFEGMREFVKTIQRLGQKYSTWRVFEDFLAMAAISISNGLVMDQERENQYLDIVGRYEREEVTLFANMFGDLIMALENCVDGGPKDILGAIYHELELHNKYKGQFFTPQPICDFIGSVAWGNTDKGEIEQKGFITVAEPCAGSGAMVLGFAKALKQAGCNYCNDMLVSAMDIDLKCVHMAYIQLSLYGIPAVVVHGNSLTVEEWSHWYTPVYVMNGWRWRKQRNDMSVMKLPKQSKNTFYFFFDDKEAI